MPDVAEVAPAPEPVAAVDPPAPAPVVAAALLPFNPKDATTWPEEVQMALRAANRADADTRGKAKLAEETQAKLDTVMKALGLKGEDDPAKAAQTAAEERDAARKEAQATKVENAVLRMAAKTGANADALTDSRAFMRTLDAIDPAAEDFVVQLEAAIKAAQEANPALRVQTAPVAAPARSGGPVGGGAPVAGQVTEAELATMTPAQIEKAQQEGRLAAILGRRPED